jgi:hypothetical protein
MNCEVSGFLRVVAISTSGARAVENVERFTLCATYL